MAVRVKEWHGRVARVVGQLSLRIETKHLSRAELSAWATELESVAAEMRATASQTKAVKNRGGKTYE